SPWPRLQRRSQADRQAVLHQLVLAGVRARDREPGAKRHLTAVPGPAQVIHYRDIWEVAWLTRSAGVTCVSQRSSTGLVRFLTPLGCCRDQPRGLGTAPGLAVRPRPVGSRYKSAGSERPRLGAAG